MKAKIEGKPITNKKDPTIINSAKTEYQERVGGNFEYYPLLGDRDPPLDYRN